MEGAEHKEQGTPATLCDLPDTEFRTPPPFRHPANFSPKRPSPLPTSKHQTLSSVTTFTTTHSTPPRISPNHSVVVCHSSPGPHWRSAAPRIVPPSCITRSSRRLAAEKRPSIIHPQTWDRSQTSSSIANRRSRPPVNLQPTFPFRFSSCESLSCQHY